MSEFDRGWNAAIEAASKAITDAPVFPKKKYGGPIADAERISVLEICRRRVETLTRTQEGGGT